MLFNIFDYDSIALDFDFNSAFSDNHQIFIIFNGCNLESNLSCLLDIKLRSNWIVLLQELLAIQQQGPRAIGFFGTRNMGFMHQELIEILSYAMVITVRDTACL
jgi:hypothetical protein